MKNFHIWNNIFLNQLLIIKVINILILELKQKGNMTIVFPKFLKISNKILNASNKIKNFKFKTKKLKKIIIHYLINSKLN